jgi:hypothetical protein
MAGVLCEFFECNAPDMGAGDADIGQFPIRQDAQFSERLPVLPAAFRSVRKRGADLRIPGPYGPEHVSKATGGRRLD